MAIAEIEYTAAPSLLSAVIQAIDIAETNAIAACLAGDMEKARANRDQADHLHAKAWGSMPEYRDWLRNKTGACKP